MAMINPLSDRCKLIHVKLPSPFKGVFHIVAHKPGEQEVSGDEPPKFEVRTYATKCEVRFCIDYAVEGECKASQAVSVQ